MRNPSTSSPTTPPPLFQSKRLCLSLLYLSTALFLALHPSPTTCLFRSSPFEPLQHPLFLYPASYGERKHALPASTPHCRSPVFFPDYQEVVREFERAVSRKNTTEVGLGLRYVQGTGREQSFGGNFSFAKRVSFFDSGQDDLIVPCGFLTDLLISELDRAAMDKCRGVVVVSAIFNDHDKIRQPRGLGSETLASGCFFMFVDDVTLTSLVYVHKVVDRKTQQLTRIGVWRLVRVPTENLYENPAMNGVIFKYLTHRLFVNARFSVWVDAKMQLVVDPLLLVHALVVEKGVDLAVSKHPFFVNTMEEAVATAAWKKWRDVEGLRRQIENYCAHGLRPWSPEKLPYTSDVPDTAIILRRHGGASDLFSCLMFNELDAFNPRDQLAFAYVRDQMRPKVKMNMFEVEVFERIAVEYRHNLKRDGGGPGPVARTNTVRAKFDSLNGSCREYLSEMWGEGGEPRDHLA